MERDLKIAGGVSSDLSCEAGICPGELLSMRFPPTPQFCAFAALLLLSRKGGLLKAALKTQALKGSGGKEGKFFLIPICTNNSQIKDFGQEREAQV